MITIAVIIPAIICFLSILIHYALYPELRFTKWLDEKYKETNSEMYDWQNIVVFNFGVMMCSFLICIFQIVQTIIITP